MQKNPQNKKARIRQYWSEGELHFYTSNCQVIQAFSTYRNMQISPVHRLDSSSATILANKVLISFEKLHIHKLHVPSEMIY